MYEQGVVVSMNSDDAELARRLNTEAAKAVKYGGVPEEEALKFVTLNSAKQMKIDKYAGSLEPGKDADFVIWNGPPLSSYSRCEQTWIDGKKYFDRAEDRDMQEAVNHERAQLIQRLLGEDKASSESKPVDEMNEEELGFWFGGGGSSSHHCLDGVELDDEGAAANHETIRESR